MIITSKKQQLESIGMVFEPDQHSNAQKLDELKARALNRTSTTAKALAEQGGFMPSKAIAQPVAPRVDRTDKATSPEALHEAYMQSLKDGRHVQE